MEIKPNVVKKNGKVMCFFEVDPKLGFEIANKKKTHIFDLRIKDPREKTPKQLKAFWGVLDEFLEFEDPNSKYDKELKEIVKETLYASYKEEKGKEITLSEASVDDARFFINWVLERFAKRGFISANLDIMDEFGYKFVTTTVIAKKCAICNSDGKIKEFKQKNGDIKRIGLCEEHYKITEKALEKKYYMKPVKVEVVDGE